MTPYLTAWEKYHEDGPPGIPWREAMEFHLQFGTVIATAGAFLMARLVRSDDPADVLFDLSPLESRECLDCWHIWAAAGNLEALALIAETHRAPFVSFLRRADLKPRVYPLARLLRHEFKAAQARPGCPARLVYRT